MGSTNVKVAELNKGPIALQKDLEFISGVAKNHRNWNLSTAQTVAALMGWMSAEKVFQLGKKAIKDNRTTAKNWNIK